MNVRNPRYKVLHKKKENCFPKYYSNKRDSGNFINPIRHGLGINLTPSYFF